MRKVRLLFIGLCTLLLPSFLLVFVLRLFGGKVGKNVKIGFSFIYANKINLGDNSKIGHFNLIKNEEVILEIKSRIGYLNILKGPFKLVLKERAIIGNKNYIIRGAKGVTYGESILQLGELACITTSHHVDVTRSITFGDFTTLAGINSQLWTHGYYHAEKGEDRIRIDGEITIGNNVYIGSGCIFNPNVTIADAIHVGSGSVISKKLEKKGMYVSSGLRFIENDIEKIKSKLSKVELNLADKVYEKK